MVKTESPSRVRRPQQDRSRSNAQALLDAGLRCIAARGIEGTMMGRVAREAGTSVGALYFRFNDKETFINAAVARGFDRILASTPDLPVLVCQGALGALDAVGLLVGWWVEAVRDNQGLFRAVLKRALSAPRYGEPLERLERHTGAILVAALRDDASITAIPGWQQKLLFGLHAACSVVLLSALNADTSPSDLRPELIRLVLACLST